MLTPVTFVQFHLSKSPIYAMDPYVENLQPQRNEFGMLDEKTWKTRSSQQWFQ